MPVQVVGLNSCEPNIYPLGSETDDRHAVGTLAERRSAADHVVNIVARPDRSSHFTDFAAAVRTTPSSALSQHTQPASSLGAVASSAADPNAA